jgi:hypothetical protein
MASVMLALGLPGLYKLQKVGQASLRPDRGVPPA